MMRRGGRSSLGRGSLWPSTRKTARDVCIVATSVGGAYLATQHVWVGLSLVCGAGLVYGAVRLYDRRWQRLQSELFRRRE